MIKKIAIAFLLLALHFLAQSQGLKKGMVIHKSIKLKAGTYTIDGNENLGRPVIVIEGNNIVVDGSKLVLKGSQGKTSPDEFFGLAILVRKGKNITIKNFLVKGFKVALMATGVEGLKIEHCDFSYNYREHLKSTPEKEDTSDWLSYHHNEDDEWLRYGAAMYLKNCDRATVSNCTVTGGQNGLMMNHCNSGNFYNNDFSFNSGVGLGLYRCSNNRILFNRINFNVRGFSFGVYARGQDSAGILVYEQSNGNLFYRNSATHGGDGFFLWAGQTTMDTGKGGCNDNQLLYNDFSYAVANGVEATFSSNQISNNRIFECDYGIWGGYSYQTAINGNQFRNNRVAIAIEHGQHNTILNNLFLKDTVGIKLWTRKEQPANWGYAQFHDTRSVDYLITLNSFNLNHYAYDLSGTDSLNIFGNVYAGVDEIIKADSTVSGLDSLPLELVDTTMVDYTIPGAMDPFKGNGKLIGRKNIRMTEWGPYDFRYPLIWQSNPGDTAREMKFELLGPMGKWKVVAAKGLIIENLADTLPGHFKGRKTGDAQEVMIEASFTGPAFTDQYGNKMPANRPVRVVWRK